MFGLFFVQLLMALLNSLFGAGNDKPAGMYLQDRDQGLFEVEQDRTLAEKQLEVYGHVKKREFAYARWAQDHNLYTLSADQLRQVEETSAVKEKEELAVRFFLQNKWRAYWESLEIGIQNTKRRYFLTSGFSLLAWVVIGIALYGLNAAFIMKPNSAEISVKPIGNGQLSSNLGRIGKYFEKWGWAILWGLVIGGLHGAGHKQTLASMPRWQLICLLPSLTGLGAFVQIGVIHVVKWHNLTKNMGMNEWMKELHHPYDPFEAVQLEYIRQKYGPGLSNEELRTRLETVGRDFYREAFDKSEKESKLITYVREGLALYRALTPLTEEEREAYREEILKKASQKLQYYHPDVQEKVYDMVDAYLHGGRVYGRVLAGPPGTGKTELTKILGSLFPDGACVEIKLGGRSPAELEGDTEGKKGYFVEAFLPVARAGKKVRVICFDEMEKALDQRAVNNRELLVTVLSLENGEYCLYSAHFNAHFVLQVMRFYPVNSKEELEVNEALLNRLPILDVPGYSAEAKYKLYTEKGGLLEKMLASMHLDLARKDDPEVLAMLKELIATDKDPGLRTLEDKVSMALTKMDRVWRGQATSAA